MSKAGKNREGHEFFSREVLDAALAEHIAASLKRDIGERGEALLAVSGGSTPAGMFAHLSRCELPWERVTVTLVDERWVPPDHPDSNERLVRRHLLCEEAAGARWVGLKTAPEDPAEGLAEAEARAAKLKLPFTVVVLGMGADGHTASWFPRAANLAELLEPDNPHLLGITDPVTAPHPRITFTRAALLNSRELILHITGEEKRRVLDEATRRGYPVAAVTDSQDHHATLWWAP